MREKNRKRRKGSTGGKTRIMMELIIHTISVPENPTYYIFSHHDFHSTHSGDFTHLLLLNAFIAVVFSSSHHLLPPLLLSALIPNLSSLLPFPSLLFHLPSCSLRVRHRRLLPLLHLHLLCLARGHSRPADQVQHVRQRHRQVGVYAPPRSRPEGADSALCSATGPWSRSHHEEPGGTDAAGLGNGRKAFLRNVSQYSSSFLL